MKITNRIFAIPAAAAAIPKNPNIAAMIATIRNTTAHPSMVPPWGSRLPPGEPFYRLGRELTIGAIQYGKAGYFCNLLSVALQRQSTIRRFTPAPQE